MKYYHYILIAIAILYLTSKVYPWIKRKRRGYVNYIKPRDLKARLDKGDDIFIADVRKPEDFTGIIGHIKDAVNLPFSILEKHIQSKEEELKDLKNTPVVVTVDFDEDYGFLAYIIFLKYGFKEVYLLDNGLSAWIKEGFFVTKDASNE